MPTTKNYRDLHRRVADRPGALERLKALRKETLLEISLCELGRDTGLLRAVENEPPGTNDRSRRGSDD